MKHTATVVCLLLCSLWTLSVWAKPAPKDMKAFNKSCPAPAECSKMSEAQDRCADKRIGACREFVRIYKKLLPEYDCQRPQDAQAEPKLIVPAIWLCENHESALEFLSHLNTRAARYLFHSEALRDSLDGDLAERYKDLSLGKTSEKKDGGAEQ